MPLQYTNEECKSFDRLIEPISLMDSVEIIGLVDRPLQQQQLLYYKLACAQIIIIII